MIAELIVDYTALTMDKAGESVRTSQHGRRSYQFRDFLQDIGAGTREDYSRTKRYDDLADLEDLFNEYCEMNNIHIWCIN